VRTLVEPVFDQNLKVPFAFAAARATFEAAFTSDMAKLLGSIDKTRINIISITAGSVVVAFYVLPDSAGTPLPETTLTSAFKATNVPVAGSKTTSTAAITTQKPAALVVPVAKSGGTCTLFPTIFALASAMVLHACLWLICWNKRWECENLSNDIMLVYRFATMAVN
jgi:hypothetical protein